MNPLDGPNGHALRVAAAFGRYIHLFNIGGTGQVLQDDRDRDSFEEVIDFSRFESKHVICCKKHTLSTFQKVIVQNKNPPEAAATRNACPLGPSRGFIR